MVGGRAGSNINLSVCQYGIMQIPIIHIDQARFSLVMAVTIGAFNNIFADLDHRDDRAGTAVYT